MMSLISTFAGIFFPHTLKIDQSNGEVYFLLYELFSARYSVKAIAKISLMEDTLREYDSSWTLSTITNHKKPLTLIATGPMTQQPSVSGFLGRAVEEKFHIKPFNFTIVPCIPLISERLKNMVHPEIGLTQLGEGVKEGYFFVNLSLDQNFEDGQEFYAFSPRNDDRDEIDELLQEQSEYQRSAFKRDDDDEIVDTPVINRNTMNNYTDDESQDMIHDYTRRRRFSDSSLDSQLQEDDNEKRDNGIFEYIPQLHNEINIKSSVTYDSTNETKGVSEINDSDSSHSTIKQFKFNKSLINANVKPGIEFSDSESIKEIREGLNKTFIESLSEASDDTFPIISKPKKDKGKQKATYPLTDDEDIPSPDASSPCSLERLFLSYQPGTSAQFKQHKQSDRSSENKGKDYFDFPLCLDEFRSEPHTDQINSGSLTPSKRKNSLEEYQRLENMGKRQRKEKNKDPIKEIGSNEETEEISSKEEAEEIGSNDKGLEIRKRGRPRKIIPKKDIDQSHDNNQPKRGRGRPKKAIENDPQAGSLTKYLLNLGEKPKD